MGKTVTDVSTIHPRSKKNSVIPRGIATNKINPNMTCHNTGMKALYVSK